MPERSKKQIAACQVRSLRTIRKKLLAMSAEWDGVDGYNETILGELAQKCEDTAVDLIDDSEGDE